jgi:hypothetical protein
LRQLAAAAVGKSLLQRRISADHFGDGPERARFEFQALNPGATGRVRLRRRTR